MTTLQPAAHTGPGRAPPRVRSNISVLILAKNEEKNIGHALDSVKDWADAVYVVDSGSTDGTRGLVEAAGAHFVSRAWIHAAEQKNWALDTLPWESDWVFILDSDEVILPQLRDELLAISQRPVEVVPEDAFYINRYLIFLGKRIRHSGYYPSWNMRFFKRGKARYEDRETHEHMVTHGPTGYLRGHMEHNDRRGLEVYMAKHNYYSSCEAREIVKVMSGHTGSGLKASLRGNALERRRWFKHAVYPRLPAKWLFRFLYTYFLRLGVLDGATGLRFCLFISTYELLIGLKIAELMQTPGGAAALQGAPTPLPPLPPRAPDAPPSRAEREPTPAQRNGTLSEEELMKDRAFQAAQVSPWTTREKIGRALWMIVRGSLFRFSWHNWYRWRAFLLRKFGAKIGKNCMIRPTVRVEIPWNVTIGDYVALGDFAIIYSLGPITIGRRVTVSQYAHLCAGTHEYTRPDLPLVRPPITIGDDAWIAADAFVGPNVTVGDGAILGACAVTMKDLKPWTIYGGNPAKAVKPRPPLHPGQGG